MSICGCREARGSANDLDVPGFVESALPFVQVCDEQQIRAAPLKCKGARRRHAVYDLPSSPTDEACVALGQS